MLLSKHIYLIWCLLANRYQIHLLWLLIQSGWENLMLFGGGCRWVAFDPSRGRWRPSCKALTKRTASCLVCHNRGIVVDRFLSLAWCEQSGGFLRRPLSLGWRCQQLLFCWSTSTSYLIHPCSQLLLQTTAAILMCKHNLGGGCWHRHPGWSVRGFLPESLEGLSLRARRQWIQPISHLFRHYLRSRWGRSATFPLPFDRLSGGRRAGLRIRRGWLGHFKSGCASLLRRWISVCSEAILLYHFLL